MVKLTVMLPVYNGIDNYPQKQLYKSISSILRLDCTTQVIVIDDCSTDGTVDYLRGAFGNGITLLRQDINGGQAAALNRALPLVVGQYVWQWGARAQATPDAVQLLHVLDHNRNADFAYGAMWSYGGGHDYMHRPPHIFDGKRFAERYVCNWYIYRANMIPGLKYVEYMMLEDNSVIGICDRDLLMQLLERGAVGIGLHDVCCVNYYNGGKHTMHKVLEHKDDIEQAFCQRWKHLLWS